MKHHVIYHDNCADGLTAAWVAATTLVRIGGTTVETVPAQYGDPPPEIAEGDDVLIVDFSYPRDVLERLAARAGVLVVLDHHATAEKALAGLPYARFDKNRSGAGLAWDMLVASWDPDLMGHVGPLSVESYRPAIVSYVEDRDLWRFLLRDSKEVNAYIGASLKFRGKESEKLASVQAVQDEIVHDYVSVVTGGRAILKYVDSYVAATADNARMVSWEGYDGVPVVNASYTNISELVGNLAESRPFAIGWCKRKDGKYGYSLRSRGPDGVDVSAIALRHGGGGHKNAAGFSSDRLLPEFE